MTTLCQDVIDQLVADTSQELLPVMVGSFIKELELKRDLVIQANRDQQSTSLRELAHSLKSCASTYGALRLRQAAKQLEDAAALDQRDAYQVLILQLQTTLDETLDVYRTYLDNLN